jgi:hypothetical protein
VLYDFGGLRVQSAFGLPGLTAARGEGPSGRSADIHLSLSRAPPPAGRPVFHWLGRYRLALDACGDDWLVRCGGETGVAITGSGQALQCHCPDLASLPLLAEIISRRVLPRVSVLHGRLPIHAATLGDGQGAIMLLGSSGSGKSTMTAALAQRLGWEIFSDDMSVLGDEELHTVFPTMPGVSVWPPSRRALGLPSEHCRPLSSYEGKVWYAPAAAPPTPQRLGALILLSFNPDGQAIECKRLAGPSPLVEVLSQLVVFNPRDTGEIAALVARFTQVIVSVPIYALSYPRDYGALPAVVDTIRRLRIEAPSELV